MLRYLQYLERPILIDAYRPQPSFPLFPPPQLHRRHQCDQMAWLPFQHFRIYNIETLPISIRNLPKYVKNFAKYLIDPLNFAKVV